VTNSIGQIKKKSLYYIFIIIQRCRKYCVLECGKIWTWHVGAW